MSGIEVSITADKEWVHAILDVKKQYNLILTKGSDCHFFIDRKADGIDLFGVTNPHLDSIIKQEAIEIFKKRLQIS